VEPEVRFCTTSDGFRIAYATMGKGSPPMISAPTWFSPFKNMAHEPDSIRGTSWGARNRIR